MTKVTLYTEYFPELPALLDSLFEGYTLLRGEGRYKGVSESSAMVILYVELDVDAHALAQRAAECIIRELNQESVWVEIALVPVYRFNRRERNQ